MILQERVDHYNKTFPTYAELFVTESGRGKNIRQWIVGTWVIGNYYASENKYYGEYPHGYLKRVLVLFPDIPEENTLHILSGKSTYGKTIDLNKLNTLNPDLELDVHKRSEHFYPNTWELILADPPYSEEDASHYGVPLVRRNIVIKECYKILRVGGYLVWLDQVYPMYSKKELLLIGAIGLIQSTNHRTRMVFIYQKQEETE